MTTKTSNNFDEISDYEWLTTLQYIGLLDVNTINQIQTILEERWIDTDDYDNVLWHIKEVFNGDETDEKMRNAIPIAELQEALSRKNTVGWSGYRVSLKRDWEYIKTEDWESFEIINTDWISHTFSLSDLEELTKDRTDKYKTQLGWRYPSWQLSRLHIEMAWFKYSLPGESPLTDTQSKSPIWLYYEEPNQWNIPCILMQIWYYVSNVWEHPSFQSEYMAVPISDIKAIATEIT